MTTLFQTDNVPCCKAWFFFFLLCLMSNLNVFRYQMLTTPKLTLSVFRSAELLKATNTFFLKKAKQYLCYGVIEKIAQLLL